MSLTCDSKISVFSASAGGCKMFLQVSVLTTAKADLLNVLSLRHAWYNLPTSPFIGICFGFAHLSTSMKLLCCYQFSHNMFHGPGPLTHRRFLRRTVRDSEPLGTKLRLASQRWFDHFHVGLFMFRITTDLHEKRDTCLFNLSMGGWNLWTQTYLRTIWPWQGVEPGTWEKMWDVPSPH